MTKRLRSALVLAALVSLAGCGNKQNSIEIDHRMGERVTVGPLTYNVIESSWRSQLGEGFRVRVPQQRFLLISISVTNGGGHQISMPLLSLENSIGATFRESDSGDGVGEWFGLLRNIDPAQTQQGRLVFDVPLGTYRLRLTNGSDAGTEKYAYVEIPLRMDGDSTVDSPLPSGTGVPDSVR
ncbi:MAG: DUF4352 domain-containing protein [Bryobacteraceae bacterium]